MSLNGRRAIYYWDKDHVETRTGEHTNGIITSEPIFYAGKNWLGLCVSFLRDDNSFITAELSHLVIIEQEEDNLK